MKLVVIESPGKQETLQKYLGKDYKVFASKGHVRDLPLKSLGIDLNKIEPTYETLPDKVKLISDLQKVAKTADQVYLATDPDREGEAISWHLAHYLGLKPEEKCRIEFNEISKSAVEKALEHPRTINQNLVDAQQTRRMLDRIVGYKISPIICKKIKSNISAGRVQSVALKLVVDREKEIKNFKPEEYWNISVNLAKQNEKSTFKANLIEKNNKKIKIANEEQAKEITSTFNNGKFFVSKLKKSKTKANAPAPFTTSTMQQEALNKLGMSLKKTSQVAQVLYEGIDLKGEGKVALITYIRSDSTRISEQAQKMAKDYILSNIGSQYYPSKPNIYGAKKGAQDAHEAIRPINLNKKPEELKSQIPADCYKLYKLIYDRFLASQMASAEYDSVSVDVTKDVYKFRATGRTLIFAGWTVVYKHTEKDDEQNEKIPKLEENEILEYKSHNAEQKFTKPPARYTEASLVKEMEEKGIGRPATYAPTITLLQSREYVLKDGKTLYPSELGTVVSDYLDKYFKKVINVKFTAQMESRLDDIAETGEDWHKVVANFWDGFKGLLVDANAGEYARVKTEPEMTDIKCDKCGHNMVIRDGKYGKFLGCSNYPNCKNIQQLPENQPKESGICPICKKPTMMRKSKHGKIFYSCSGYPDCNFMSWDEPTGEYCPKCKEYLVKKQYKNKSIIKCSNNKCDYSHEIEQDK